ncbi:hypothetical protein DIPPA_05802 [Diplonema papillatum]|nr:hypothetical protein DIPPA_05802 [Diplonema papillatum]
MTARLVAAALGSTERAAGRVVRQKRAYYDQSANHPSARAGQGGKAPADYGAGGGGGGGGDERHVSAAAQSLGVAKPGRGGDARQQWERAYREWYQAYEAHSTATRQSAWDRAYADWWNAYGHQIGRAAARPQQGAWHPAGWSPGDASMSQPADPRSSPPFTMQSPQAQLQGGAQPPPPASSGFYQQQQQQQQQQHQHQYPPPPPPAGIPQAPYSGRNTLIEQVLWALAGFILMLIVLEWAAQYV